MEIEHAIRFRIIEVNSPPYAFIHVIIVETSGGIGGKDLLGHLDQCLLTSEFEGGGELDEDDFQCPFFRQDHHLFVDVGVYFPVIFKVKLRCVKFSPVPP